MNRSVRVYEWPDSQLCMECAHGRAVADSEKNEYICDLDHPYNKGGFCIRQTPKAEDSE